FVRDMQTGVTSQASVNQAGTGGGNSFSELPVGGNAISADGRYVVFFSDSTDLVPNTVANDDVYLRTYRLAPPPWSASCRTAATPAASAGSSAPTAATSPSPAGTPAPSMASATRRDTALSSCATCKPRGPCWSVTTWPTTARSTATRIPSASAATAVTSA